MEASIFAIIASLIYVPSIALICTNAMKKMAKEQEKIGFHQTKMFIRAAIVELISVMFIIGAFLQLENSTKSTNENSYLYFLFLLVIVLGSLLYMFIEYHQLKVDLKKKNEEFAYLKTIFPISIALAVAVPIVSLVILLIQFSQIGG